MFIVVMRIEPVSEWVYGGTSDGSLTIANSRIDCEGPHNKVADKVSATCSSELVIESGGVMCEREHFVRIDRAA